MSDAEIKMWVAVIAAVSALAVAVYNSIATFRAQRRLEKLRADFAQQNAERDARRDYEYEARKRLYAECEPLLFDLYELAVGAMKRVHSLARAARDGNIRTDGTGWLDGGGDAYYLLSTVYKLVSPLVVFKVIQRHLTLIDLSLDNRIREQYLLTRCAYFAFTADFKLAKTDPRLPYDPNEEFGAEGAEAVEQKRRDEPARYCRQGFSVGRLDNAIEALLVADGKGRLRGMSFGEFESAYNDPASSMRKRFQPALDLFVGFHPQTRPVLWRILVTQLHLYRTVVENSETDFQRPSAPSPFAPVPPDEHERYDWRRRDARPPETNAMVEQPFCVAAKYLEKRLAAHAPAGRAAI